MIDTKNPYKTPHTFRRLLVWTVTTTFAVIVLGAWVRVAGAGLACPDWPQCYGQWLPFPPPDGGYVVGNVTFTTGQVLLEWGHRLLAAVAGFLFLGVLFFAVQLRRENARFLPLALAALVALFVQVNLGGMTVLLDNINWSVALHLGTALIFYTCLMLLLMAAIRPPQSSGIKAAGVNAVILWAAPVVVYMTMLLGAMVSTSHGGGACGGLFDCAGRWLPADDPVQALHMIHRYAGLLTLLTAIALFLALRTQAAALAKTGRVFMIFTLIQAFVGVLVLYSFSHYAWAYQGLSVFHLAWGTIVYTIALTGVVKHLWGAKDPAAKTLPGHP